MIPQNLRAGSAYSWTENKFDAGDGTLEYTIFNGSAVYTVSGDGVDFALTSADTKSWRNGKYSWVLRRVVDAEREDLASGRLEILPNPNISPNGLDDRTHAERVLEALEATLENRATDDMDSFTIRGRTISSMPIKDLLSFRALYKREVAAEANARRLAAGLPSNRFIRTRFVND